MSSAGALPAPPSGAGAKVTGYTQAMDLALTAAAAAAAAGDVPVGAVILDAAGEVVASAGNEREQTQDPTAHAEILALRRAAAVSGSWRLVDHTLVVTLEPCTMCAGAAVLARISRLVIGTWDPKAGAVSSLWDVVRDPHLNHRIEVISGIRAAECADQLRRFFNPTD